MLHPFKFLCLAALFCAACASNPTEFTLQDGDLLFVVTNNSELSNAITAATADDNHKIKNEHVAIFFHNSLGQPAVLEAVVVGVWLIPWEKFVARMPIIDTAAAAADSLSLTAGRGLVVKRLAEPVDIKKALERAKSHIGDEYDWSFRANNGKMYCTELVYDCYLGQDGEPVMQSVPMSFRDSEGNIPEFWVRTYERLGEPIPEGEPGTNPNAMAADPALVEVHRYF